MLVISLQLKSEARSLSIEATAAEAAKANARSVKDARDAATSDLNQMRQELEDRLTAIANDRTADREREAAAAEAQALADARAALVQDALEKIRARAASEAAVLAEVKDDVTVLYADRHHHDQHDRDRRTRLEEHCRSTTTNAANTNAANTNTNNSNLNDYRTKNTYTGAANQLCPLAGANVAGSHGGGDAGVGGGRSAEWLVEKALDALYHPLVNPTTV